MSANFSRFSVLFGMLILMANFTLVFGQKTVKKAYFENTFSPFNITPQPGSGLLSDYYIAGKMNSLMLKAGLNNTHIFRIGFSDYEEFLSLSFFETAKIIKNSKSEFYNVYGNDFRLGYQYNYKNDSSNLVPFLGTDFLISTFNESNNGPNSPIFYNNTVSTGLIINPGLKLKIGNVIVLNIETGLFIGRYKSRLETFTRAPTYNIHFEEKIKNISCQFYPLKISLGVRIGDSNIKR